MKDGRSYVHVLNDQRRGRRAFCIPFTRRGAQAYYKVTDLLLFIDGERVGRAGNAPLKKTIAAGERRVEARLPGFEPAEATVSVYEQEKEDVRLELRRK